MDFTRIVDFIRLINAFRTIKRTVSISGPTDKENDAEHSYQVAMLAWYIASANDLGLDIDLVIKYGLVHDFVEVYAGDSSFYRSESESKVKKDKEHEAAATLKETLPEFADLHEFIERYEKREDEESRFVYALDKVVPIINIYLNGGHDWREHKVTLERLIENKTDKVAYSRYIEPYFNDLLKILEKNRDMFHVEQVTKA
ncbi:hypothetical protein A3D62_03055 [Candidatus Kaiserbacteria bacterium RIFCSPHIGHO2_02_FULL_49_11]|uniref:5'-deoxynucleotidase n=1 Tax=Candidatus Kaiserbacteria bacterium RIFCSPHIGHO2_02_FULL_49_11 TaxID=1798489 RepID=A0A1F6D0P1_9BACT|nr:MAG: hypothetical protein A3D62_03055 [Candidatus Kaiserbacteria bacterium RIFCSPHIGHO2_02_FULL_49_11]